MLSALDSFINKMAPYLALETAESSWADTVRTSIPGRLWTGSQNLLEKISRGRLAAIGSYLELASFGVVLVLIACLGMPQFASDKMGLAGLVALGLALRLAGCLLGGREKYRLNGLDMAVLVILYVNIIATFASHYLLPSIKGLAKVLVYVSSFFLFASSFNQSSKRVIIAFSTLFLTACAVSAYGLYQYKTGVQPLATWEDPSVLVKSTRIYSTLGNPNLLAGFLIPVLPVGVALWMITFLKRRWFLGLPVLVGTAVILLACLLTGSRGGYVGILGGAGLVFWICSTWIWIEHPRYRWTIFLALALIPVALFLAVQFVPSMEHRVMSMFAGRDDSSNSFRMNVWLASLAMFMDSWWIGIGPGNSTFRLAYGLYMTSGYDALGAYCVPLEVACETGVIGLAAAALLMIVFFSRAHINFWRTEDSAVRWLVIATAAGVAGLMVHGLVDTIFYRPQVHLVFWLLIAACQALNRDQKPLP